MKAKYFSAVLAVLFLCIGLISVAAPEKDSKPATASTGLENQTGVAVTIYNVNLGLVKDQRSLKLSKGTGELKFMDVASQIIPTSVHIKSLVNADSLQILAEL